MDIDNEDLTRKSKRSAPVRSRFWTLESLRYVIHTLRPSPQQEQMLALIHARRAHEKEALMTMDITGEETREAFLMYMLAMILTDNTMGDTMHVVFPDMMDFTREVLCVLLARVKCRIQLVEPELIRFNTLGGRSISLRLRLIDIQAIQPVRLDGEDWADVGSMLSLSSGVCV